MSIPVLRGPDLPSATTGVTQANGDNSTKLATTAFVQNFVGVAHTWTGVQTFSGNNTYRLQLQSSDSGRTSIAQTHGGMLLTASAMSASAQYTPIYGFGSTDGNLTTSNPKLLAGITGVATEAYAVDAEGGMGIEFWGSANDPGTAPALTSMAVFLTSGLTFTPAATFSSTLTTRGNLSVNRVGDSTTANVVLNTDAGFLADVCFQTAGVNRWIIRKNATAESGSNAGSDLDIIARDDAGSGLHTAIRITRSTGVVNFFLAPTFSDASGTRTNLGLGTAATVADNTLVHLAGTETITGAKTFSSILKVTGSTLHVDGAGAAANRFILLDADAGFVGQFHFRTGTLSRWAFNKTAAAESGGNAGSDFQLVAYDDSGVSLGTAFSIVRATRVMTFPVAPAFTDAAGTRTNLGLGTANNVQFATITGTTGTFSSLTANAGNITADRTGDSAAAAIVALADAGQHAQVNLAGSADRWVLRKNNAAESGSNAGSNFELNAYNDAGSLLGSVFTVTRSSRVLNFTIAPTFTDAATTRTNLGLGTAAVANTGTTGTALGFLDGANTWSGAQTYTAILTVGHTLHVDRAGDATGANFLISSDAGQTASVTMRTGSNARWNLFKTSTAETGSDAGSDLNLTAHNDAGTSLGTVFTITRATRVLAFTVSPTAPTPTAGDNSTKVATTAYVRAAAAHSSYRNLLERDASHTAGKTAATYAIGTGDPAAVSGTGTLYPQGVFYYDPADHPTLDGLAPKLRIRAQVFCNDVAPTGTYIIGLYPVTRPATSGAAGLCIYTLGTVVSGSQTSTVNAPAADSSNQVVGSDFAAPAAGYYVLGFVQTGTVAASAHMHIAAQLQMRNN